MKKLFLIDATGYLHRAYHALPPMSNAAGESTQAVFGFVRSILKLIDDFSPTYLAAIFDGPRSLEKRLEMHPEYKAHRKPSPPDLPLQIQRAAEFCDLLGIPRLTIAGVEADDTMGTVATVLAGPDTEVYLCSSDKDLCQLVGDHIFILNTFKDNLVLDAAKVEELYGVRPDQMIDLLAMMGDASDNIPGLSGFGQKTAASLLQQHGTLEALLENPALAPGKKKQETLAREGEIARLSRQLATLNLAVDGPTEFSFFALKEPDLDSLRRFYHEMQFNTLLRSISAPAKEEHSVAYTIVDDEAGLEELISHLETHKEICIDPETTGLRPLQAELVGIGLGVKSHEAFYVPCNGKLGRARVLEGLRPLFENPNRGFYGHNVKYDLHILANEGFHVANICFDTIIASYVLNSHSRRHGLDHLSLHYFDKVKTPISDLIGKGKSQKSMADVPIERVGPYCCEDVDYTIRLKERLEGELEERKLMHIVTDVEMPLLPILAKMERTGIYVEVAQLEQMAAMLSGRISGIAEEVYQLAGEPFNISSPKQLSKILFDKLGIRPPKKTATGYSTAADVLDGLKESYPIAGKVIEFRMLDKLRSTYVETLPREVNPQTGRVHCTFNQYVAATGRLSCTDPNLQNIPVRTPEGREIRAAFKPEREGYVFLSADYSQIELRLLAHLSEDPMLLEAFNDSTDIHAFTASLIFGVPLKEVTKQQRFAAKAVNFGILYGQQAFGLSREIGISVQEAAQFIETYFKRYPRAAEYLDRSKASARESGRAVTMIGRERLIPDINSKNAIARAAALRLAVNTPLQGSAADLIKLAMLEVDKSLRESNLEAKMILQIHDELIFELPESEIDLLIPVVKAGMEQVMQLKVPLVVDIAIGKNWKEC